MGFTDNNVSEQDARDLTKYIETIQKMSDDVKHIKSEIETVCEDINRLLKILKALRVIDRN